jgi:hypothetical protein
MPVPIYRLRTDEPETTDVGKAELARPGHEVIPDDVIDRQIREDAVREPAGNLLKDGKDG